MGPFLKGGQRAQPGCRVAQEPLARTRHHTDQAETGSGSRVPAPNAALGMVPELLWGRRAPRLIPTHLTIPEEAFPIDVSLGFTYFW